MQFPFAGSFNSSCNRIHKQLGAYQDLEVQGGIQGTKRIPLPGDGGSLFPLVAHWPSSEYPLMPNFSTLADPAKDDSPQLSGDMQSPENMEQWVRLFEALDLVLLTGNLIVDLVDPEKMACYRELKEKLTEHDLHDGPPHVLTLHSSMWTNMPIHANQLQSLPHKDSLSSHLGSDQIFPFGPFQ